MCEADPELTITYVDGVSAFDLTSRLAIGGIGYCGRWSGCPLFRPHVLWATHLWEDAEGTVHTINRGEGGEQGDALMSLLFSLGQHSGLGATHRRLRVNVKIVRLLRCCVNYVQA